MKLFKEIKHILGLDDGGNRAWVNPEETGATKTLEEHHAADINAQFVNTGIKLVEVEQKEESPIIDPHADVIVKNPTGISGDSFVDPETGKCRHFINGKEVFPEPTPELAEALVEKNAGHTGDASEAGTLAQSETNPLNN